MRALAIAVSVHLLVALCRADAKTCGGKIGRLATCCRVNSQKIQSLETSASNENVLLNRIEKLEKVVTEQSVNIEELKQNLSVAEDYFGYMTKVKASAVHNGHKYYINGVSISRGLADSACRVLGGYVVEIDDKNEYLFVKDLIQANEGGRKTWTFLGAKDDITEGQWYLTHSKKPMTYTNFKPDTPDNWQNQDCLAIDPSVEYLFNDISCKLKGTYICEAE